MYNCTSDPNLINCIFTRNTANKEGGALFNCVHGSKPILINCTFIANFAKYHGGGICNKEPSDPTLTNCILWGNSDRDGVDESAQVHGVRAIVNYCCIQGWTGDFGGTGNIGLEPLLVDMDNDNYHLLPESPCIDAGDNLAVPASVDVDLDDKARFIDGDGNGTVIVDMGAYEYGRP
jgi:predicted outer membrane repeat protein